MSDRGVGVGLVGFGTIGTGVVRILHDHAEPIAERLGFPLRLVRIADIDLERIDRRYQLSEVPAAIRYSQEGPRSRKNSNRFGIELLSLTPKIEAIRVLNGSATENQSRS